MCNVNVYLVLKLKQQLENWQDYECSKPLYFQETIKVINNHWLCYSRLTFDVPQSNMLKGMKLLCGQVPVSHRGVKSTIVF